ncbi:hypothetical protein U9M48_020663 [Paspalum notatum var. saurae]|uniref:Wall-associated receptor kinase C-terminal domain-containing protein n=1 Tax=Paspalum notatum var. saurae TaxID=547442 RepID=A0AAQ3WSY0_PASNO
MYLGRRSYEPGAPLPGTTAAPTAGCQFSAVPVLPESPELKALGDYESLMRRGFLMQWTVPGDCAACNASGGQCRFDTGAMNAFRCYCPDGRRLPATCAPASVNSSIDQLATLMHPTVLLLPLVASLLLLLVLQDHVSADDCEPARCGNLTLRYPFWLSINNNETSSPCGHKAFGVWCSDGGSMASLRGSSIHVLAIDYTNDSLVASHNKVAGDDGVCQANFNISSSIALSPFSLSSRNRALCFLYNCNGTVPTLPDYANATSNCSTPIYAYLAGAYIWNTPPAIPTGGCEYAYVPVLGTEAATMTAANYSRLLKDGFVLDWDPIIVGDCPTCNSSGGQCRYDNTTGEFWCLCPGGRRAASTCAGPMEIVLCAELSLSGNLG